MTGAARISIVFGTKTKKQSLISLLYGLREELYAACMLGGSGQTQFGLGFGFGG